MNKNCIFFVVLCLLIFKTDAFLNTSNNNTTNYQHNYIPRTRSLNGAPATDGDEKFNNELYSLVTLHILKGINIFKIRQFNDRHFLERTRRHYWFGDRYFRQDNLYWLSTRDTCAYRMNETERAQIVYEDNLPIFDIFYQCLRYEEYCCGLNCCRMENFPKQIQRREDRNFNNNNMSTAIHLSKIFLTFVIALLLF